MEHPPRNWKIFYCSVFFVLGFSVIFSLVGIALQTLLASSAPAVQRWLGRIGGAFVILFGLFMVGLLDVPFLHREHKFRVGRFTSAYLTSFLFGAAFAIGWTPCVTAALGAILALATTQMASAFLLLVAYTVGLGVPFLLVGLFTSQAQTLIEKAGKWLQYSQYIFGIILIVLGILVFTSQLSRIANVQFAVNLLTALNITSSAGAGISSLNLLNLLIAFLAGVVSFLSPCVLPLIPGFLSYLASVSVKQ